MRSSDYLAIEPRYAAYRRESARIGLTLLFFLLLYNGLSLSLVSLRFQVAVAFPGAGSLIARELFDMLVYLFSFLPPILFHRLLTPKKERIPMALSPTMPRSWALVIPAALAVIFCAAVVNSFVLRILGLNVGNAYPTPDPSARPFETVLYFMSAALLPALCEELLFRGLLLPQLLPYGKTVAILGSGLLFGLVHQSAGQVLYTTVAGIVLAYLAVESGSIWAGVIVHLLNNLLTVIDGALWDRLPYEAEILLYSILELMLIGIGLFCLALLLRRGKAALRSPRALRAGTPLAAGSIRGFLSLPMTLFCLISALIMVLWIYVQ